MPAVTVYRRWFGGQDASAWSRTFDAVEVEDHVFETEVTDSPVETGCSISDHAYDRPDKLTITAAVSDLPPAGKALDNYALEGPSRSAAAYAWLKRMRRAHEPFSVQTGLDLFPSMIITSLKAKKDAQHENILYFVVELKEIIWVTTQVVLFPAHPKVKRAAAKKKDDGEKSGEDPDEAIKKKVKKTFLRMGYNFITGQGGSE
jgi:hypothetical protein